MRRGWLAVLVGLVGCFQPTDIDGSGSATAMQPTGSTTDGSAESPTGNDPTGNDPTGNDPTGGDPTGDDPTSADATTWDATAESTGTETSATSDATDSLTATTGVAECQVDADCVAGTCVDGACVETPAEGPYGPCGACAADEIEAVVAEIEGCYCAPACTNDADCPVPAEGNAQPSCALVDGSGRDPVWCMLSCDPMDAGACPSGAICQVSAFDSSFAICTYPM